MGDDNNVWDSLGGFVSNIGSAAATVIDATKATPGTPAPATANPFPGTVGTYPQAQVKQGQASTPNIFTSLGLGGLTATTGGMLLVGLLAFLLLRRIV